MVGVDRGYNWAQSPNSVLAWNLTTLQPSPDLPLDFCAKVLNQVMRFQIETYTSNGSYVLRSNWFHLSNTFLVKKLWRNWIVWSSLLNCWSVVSFAHAHGLTCYAVIFSMRAQSSQRTKRAKNQTYWAWPRDSFANEGVLDLSFFLHFQGIKWIDKTLLILSLGHHACDDLRIKKLHHICGHRCNTSNWSTGQPLPHICAWSLKHKTIRIQTDENEE